MALETVRLSVGAASWVQIGSSVTALTATEHLSNSGLRVYIVAAGGTAPSGVSEANYQEWDKEYIFSGPSADIYVLSLGGDTFVGVVRA